MVDAVQEEKDLDECFINLSSVGKRVSNRQVDVLKFGYDATAEIDATVSQCRKGCADSGASSTATAATCRARETTSCTGAPGEFGDEYYRGMDDFAPAWRFCAKKKIVFHLNYASGAVKRR